MNRDFNADINTKNERLKEKETVLKILCVSDMWSLKFDKLINYFDKAEDVFAASKEDIISSGLQERDADNIKDEESIKKRYTKVLEIMRRDNIGFVLYNEEKFPKKLLNIERPVHYLFYRGSLPKEDERTCGIVGARNCTEYGRSKAFEVAKNLSSSGISIISGMARGVDKAAHEGSLAAGGKTYAVLGSGVDICYPQDNIEIYEMIRENGGVISEFLPGSSPMAWHFPHRNRIISGLSDTIAVIEAGKKSGSLITASLALQMGRDIFALPGRVDDKQSMGCNELIRDGAGMIFNGLEICESMGCYDKKIKNNNKKIKQTLEKDSLKVYSCVDLFPKNVESIVRETGLMADKVRLVLVELEMLDLVREISKDYYVIYQGEH